MLIKNKKIVFVMSGIILLLGIVIGTVYHFRVRKTYELYLPQSESLESISLEQNAMGKVVLNDTEMEEVLNSLNGLKRITKKESIQDAPVDAENEIRIDFHYKESGTSTIFVYKRINKYYIEQPYNGIYRISGDEYNTIEKYAR